MAIRLDLVSGDSMSPEHACVWTAGTKIEEDAVGRPHTVRTEPNGSPEPGDRDDGHAT